jgi:hypothetical protein
MQAKPYDYVRHRRIQVIVFTALAALLSIGLVVGLIVFCYQSSHLRM